jgi:AraC-like DNA-binding protein/ligand-binding sensor protein
MSEHNKRKNCSQNNKRTRLLELVEKDVLISLLRSFTNATGLTANIVDTDGRSIFSKEDAQQNCEFCQLIWQYQRETSIQRCSAAYARAGAQAAMFGEPYIFRCPAGLIEWAAPIIIDGEHFGSIICGQVLMWEPEDFFWIELKAMNKNIIDDFNPLMEAAKKLKVVSGKKVQAAADMLFVAASNIMKSGWESLRNRQELSRQQSLLNEEIQNRKALEKKLHAQNTVLQYSLEKERELVSKVKLDDHDGALKAFQEMLADIFIVEAANIPAVKARVLELLVVVSRAAVDAGAEFGQILEINTYFLRDISSMNSIGEIDLGAIQTLEKYMKAVQRNDKVKNHQIINKIKEFIRCNYHRGLTLEEIAESVYLSPYYISRIFKEEQNITVMDYLTKVRLEEAKKLLRNPRYNIDEISDKLGYSDPSYFSKVFRRYEGVSPSQFRQKA